MIDFLCPKCNTGQRVENNMAGQKLPCRTCGQRLQVPQPPEMRTMQGVAAPIPAPAGAARPTTEWHYERNGQRYGPVGEADLKALVAQDNLAPNDKVWREGMSDWQDADAVLPRLFARRSSSAVDRAEASARRWEGIGVAFYAVLVGGFLLGLLGLLYPIVRNRMNKTVVAAEAEEDKKSSQQKTPEPLKDLTTKELAARCRPSVARVQTRTSTGSGFLIEPGIVVTNAHVINGELIEHLQVTFPSAEGGSTPLRAKLLYEDPKRDLAVLKIASKLPPLKLDEGVPSVGEKVVVIGSPGTGIGIILENTVTEGNLGAPLKKGGVDYYHVTAAINGGNSGGPVFNAQGQVIGVVTWKIVKQGQEGQGFAVTLPDVREALRKAKKNDSTDEMERASAEHDLAEVYQRLALASITYERTMQIYIARMGAAEKRGEHFIEGVKRGRAEYAPLVGAFNKELLGAFETDLARVFANGALPKRLRDDEDMHNLRKLYLEEKQAVDGPRYPPTRAYQEQYQKFDKRSDDLIKVLSLKLGIAGNVLGERAAGVRVGARSLGQFLSGPVPP